MMETKLWRVSGSRILSAVMAIIAVMTPATVARAQTEERIVLEVGKGLLLPSPDLVEAVFVADTSIADANLSPAESIFIYGKAVGQTSLIGAGVNGEELYRYEITVTENLGELRQSLGRRFPGEAISLESSRGSIFVTGSVSTEQVRANVIRTIEAAVPASAVIDELTVARSNLIRLQVRLLEVSSSRIGRYGISWNAIVAENGFFIGTKNNGTLSFGSSDSSEDSLEATIDLLVSNGVASIAQETTLSTVNGQDAEFAVGGEIPIPQFFGDAEVRDTGNYGLEYKFIGTRLVFTPSESSGNKLRLAISSSVTSAQGESSTVNGNSFPNLSTRMFRTNVELSDRQSFVIAGLSRNESVSSLREPRGKGASGLVNALFGADRVTDSGQELVVIVTPILSEFEPATRTDSIIRRPSNLEYILSGGTQGGKIGIFGPVAPIAGFRY